VGDDARDGVAAAVVVAEDLREEAPDGRDRAEHPVAVLDAVFGQDVEDAGLGQDVRERQPLVAREAGADGIQVRHSIAFDILGRDCRSRAGVALVGRDQAALFILRGKGDLAEWLSRGRPKKRLS
jgi:hypothetical protein